MDPCENRGESYTWCRTNAHKLSSIGWWGKCGVVGQTVNGEECMGECGTQGEYYWWCHTRQDKSKWDYCSPTSEVRRVQYTRHGHECLGECGQYGENYWWCSKSIHWEDDEDDSSDYWWEYCSPDAMHTR